ncbi:TPA: hypothetical protein ACIAJC_001622 [Citrobacter freundii]
MSTTPTNQPVPSEKPQDLKFNAGKIDEFVTSMAQQYIDRFGQAHYTIEGLRWVAQQAIAAFGYITLDSFEDGNTLTLPNQVLRLEATGEYYRWDGAFPKTVPAGSTPDSAGGIGDGAWVAVGAAAFGQSIAIVDSVKDLMAVSDKSANNVRQVTGYVPGTDFGGGQFYWDASKPKSQHNGITIFSPTVPWDGSYAGLTLFLAGTGESDASGMGCWVRSYSGADILTSWAGHDVTGANAADVSVTAAIKLSAKLKTACRADAGSTIKCGFTTKVQAHDKHNIFTQSSFVLDGLKYFRFYAEKDVNIDTYHPSYKERTVFFLNNCSAEIEGFKWNWEFTNYSINPDDTEHDQGEWWSGVVIEKSENVVIKNNMVNAAQFFVRADTFSIDSFNNNVRVIDNYIKYVTNYCFLSRKLNYAEFSRNEVWYNGRTWHTYGEAFAPTTYTKNVVACNNKFYQQIAEQSCITPGSYMDTCLISENFCQRARGIFVEVGSASNVTISNNQSYSTGERDGSHILLVSGGVDDEPAGGLSNLLITGNVLHGGPYSMREYNTGTPLRRGITFSNNHIVNCPAPIMSNQSYIAMKFTGNYVEVPDDFPDLVWAGQYPIIESNTLVGVRIRMRGLGYSVIHPKITDNTFRQNTVGTKFPALLDLENFYGATIRDNDTYAASFDALLPSPANVVKAGFKYLDAGLDTHPFGRYGSKCVSSIGDYVRNDNPSPSLLVSGWMCINAATQEWRGAPLS